MTSFTKKQQVAILIVIIITILSLGKYSLSTKRSEEITEFEKINTEELEVDNSLEKSDTDTKAQNTDKSAKELVVYVKGAVKTPGIVTMTEGDRLTDAIERAGGAEAEADFNKINLARKVEDEEMIHIPYIGEAIEEPTKETISSSSSSKEEKEISKVNINTADKEELKTLSGVGDSTSDKIVSYREENVFKKIEDIMEVSGIGEKKFEAIKENITVE